MEHAKTTLATSGIKCEGCVSSAKAALSKLPGIQKVDFDIPGKTVTVIHDVATSSGEISKILFQAGFAKPD